MTANEQAPALPRPRHHGNRWVRSAEARAEVMEAVDNLLLERGFASLTIEAVAERAGVGKQTIYRWWRSKVDLLRDAFLDEIDEELPEVSTGALDADCRALLAQLVEFFERASNAAMFSALAGHAQHDAQAAVDFRREVLGAVQARCHRRFEAAGSRGEWPAGKPTAGVIEGMLAPLFYRLLVTGEPLRDLDIDAITEAALAAPRL